MTVVSISRSDLISFAKAFKPKAQDTANWPSGLTCVECAVCQSKPSTGVLAVQKHLRLVLVNSPGKKAKQKQITCRMMPKIFCFDCYQSLSKTLINTMRKAPGLLPLTTSQTSGNSHPSIWSIWVSMRILVDQLSQNFVENMSNSLANGRETDSFEINEFGQERIVFESRKPRRTAASLLAAISTPIPTPSISSTS